MMRVALRAIRGVRAMPQPASKPEERRRFPRVRTELKVLVSWDVMQELVRVQDLSEGGLFIRTSHPSEPGTVVHLELQDMKERPLCLEGIVVWVRREADQLGEPGM